MGREAGWNAGFEIKDEIAVDAAFAFDQDHESLQPKASGSSDASCNIDDIEKRRIFLGGRIGLHPALYAQLVCIAGRQSLAVRGADNAMLGSCRGAAFDKFLAFATFQLLE